MIYINFLFQKITFSTVIVFGVCGFVFGFLLKLQGFIKEKKKLTKLVEDAGTNRSYISSLKEKAEELTKINLELGGKGGEE